MPSPSKASKSFALTPAQWEIYKDNSRFKILRCGRRFGKSMLCAAVITEKAFSNPGHYWFVAPTYKQAKMIIWKIFGEMIPENAIAKRNETELIIYLHNGSEISVKGADNPDSLRGTSLDGLVLDEFAFMDASCWNIVRPSLFDRRGWAIFTSTPNGYNHFYEMWEKYAENPSWSRFHFTSFDNPYLDPEDLEEYKVTESMYQQEVMAEFTKAQGAIWPNFSRDVHVVPRREPDPNGTIFGAIDFGFAKDHPTGVGWFEVRGEEVFMFDGFLVSQETMPQLMERMKMQIGGLHLSGLFPDPARPDLIEELARQGWPVRDVSKDVELGISKVAEYFNINPLTNKPRLTISAHLKDHIRQIENYQWEESRRTTTDAGETRLEFKQRPKKQDDETPDLIRYFVFNYANRERKPRLRAKKRYDQFTGRVIS